MSLQTGAQVLGQEVPQRASFPTSHYVTTSDAVLNHRLVEISPTSDIDYSTSASDIVFPISAAVSMWDMQNSWIRGKLQVTVSNHANKLALLEQGGIHSLFKEIEISAAATGVVLDRINNYNLCQAMESEIIHSPEYVDTMLCDELDASVVGIDKTAGAQGVYEAAGVTAANISATSITLASPGPDYVLPGDIVTIASVNTQVGADVAYTQSEASYAQSGQVLTLATTAGGADTSKLAVGDLLRLEEAADNNVVRILTIVDALSVTVEGLPAANISANSFLSIKRVYQSAGVADVRRVRYVEQNGVLATTTGSTYASGTFDVTVIRRGGDLSVRHLAPQSTVHTFEFSMRPRIGFLRQSKFFPLFLMHGGIRLTLKLDPALSSNSFIYPGAADSTAAAAVVLSNLRYMATFVDMHASVNMQYLDLYSNRGLLIPFLGVETFEQAITAGTTQTSINWQVGHRSARFALARCIGQNLYNSSSATGKQFPSLSYYPDSGIKNWGFESGSIRLPSKEIDVTLTPGEDNTNPVPAQTLRHMQKTFQKIYDLWGDNSEVMPYVGNPSMRTPGWGHRKRRLPGVSSTNTALYPTIAYPKLLMSQILGRDIAGKFAGLDLSIQPLKFNLQFAYAIEDNSGLGQGLARYVHLFVYYDRYTHLSKMTGASRLS